MDNKLMSLDEIQTLGQVFVKSGFFSDARDASQAVVKILAGRELGLSAITSMTGIFVIQNRVTVGANLIAAKVKSSGKYDYKVVEHTEKACVIDFFERKGDSLEKIGTSSFTVEDARKAGTKNLEKFPRNMLFARAMSNGAKWYCPDAFSGLLVYTPDELGANVEYDDQGNVTKVIDGEAKVVKQLPKAVEYAIKITCPQQQWEAFASDVEIASIAGTPPNLEKVALALKGVGVEELTPDNILEAKTALKLSIPHWSEDPKKRAAWFANLNTNVKINEKELTMEQIHEALGVEHLKEFKGSGKDAFVKVRDWALK